MPAMVTTLCSFASVQLFSIYTFILKSVVEWIILKIRSKLLSFIALSNYVDFEKRPLRYFDSLTFAGFESRSTSSAQQYNFNEPNYDYCVQ